MINKLYAVTFFGENRPFQITWYYESIEERQKALDEATDNGRFYLHEINCILINRNKNHAAE